MDREYENIRHELQELQRRVQSIFQRVREFDWLVNLINESKIEVRRIVNVGCNTGAESIALHCCFQALETVGLDSDQDKIMQAQSTPKSYQPRIERLKNYIQWYPDALSGYKLWWENELPDSFKDKFVEAANTLRFVVDDITKLKSLSSDHSDHYDLVYCRYTLYHIWRDSDAHSVESAVREMKRIVRLGGLVAVSEPMESEAQIIDLVPVFEGVGLEIVYREFVPITPERNSIRLVGRKTD